MGETKEYAEITLPDGQKVILDKEDYVRLPWKDKWRIYTSNGRIFVGRTNGPRGAITFMSAILFTFDRWRQKIVFKNGNRQDYRRENVEFPLRQGNKLKPNVDLFLARRHSKTTEISKNGCVLIKAKSGKRCDRFLTCEHYTDCLDTIASTTEWPGWKTKVA